MTGEALQAYHGRMRRVLDHIDAHLDADLSVEALSGVAAFSRFHFHRQFSALFGLGVGRYVQQARLKRAAHRLAFRTDPITEIALDSGYEPEAFSTRLPAADRPDAQRLSARTVVAPLAGGLRAVRTCQEPHDVQSHRRPGRPGRLSRDPRRGPDPPRRSGP